MTHNDYFFVSFFFDSGTSRTTAVNRAVTYDEDDVTIIQDSPQMDPDVFKSEYFSTPLSPPQDAEDSPPALPSSSPPALPMAPPPPRAAASDVGVGVIYLPCFKYIYLVSLTYLVLFIYLISLALSIYLIFRSILFFYFGFYF